MRRFDPGQNPVFNSPRYLSSAYTETRQATESSGISLTVPARPVNILRTVAS